MNKNNANAFEKAREHAFAWLQEHVSYKFTKTERRVLDIFFTNTDKKVFFVYGMPEAMSGPLMSMFSRIKNKRGIRGVFVDLFLPSILASQLLRHKHTIMMDPEKFLRENNITTLDQFCSYSIRARYLYWKFYRKMRRDKAYIKTITTAKRIARFLSIFLDKFGHNSIARVASATMCMEGISLLAAKSVEWSRPGCGFIELSTRFVDMSNPALVPAFEWMEYWNIPENDLVAVKQMVKHLFATYRQFSDENNPDSFASFLYRFHTIASNKTKKKLRRSVRGEVCDVLGNLLPAMTATSVCAHVSCEALDSVLKHLRCEGLSETSALADCLAQEAAVIGDDQFIRHDHPTAIEKRNTIPLATERARFHGDHIKMIAPTPEGIAITRIFAAMGNDEYASPNDIDPFIHNHIMVQALTDSVEKNIRTEYDRLPRAFEEVRALFSGTMSFRSWRDLQRQGFSTHRRTLLTPLLGFYIYPKWSSDELRQTFDDVASLSKRCWEKCDRPGIPRAILQYMLPIGWNVGFNFGANFRQIEFCTWQRTKRSVHDEVRGIFLEIYQLMCDYYPWWTLIARVDPTEYYLFART